MKLLQLDGLPFAFAVDGKLRLLPRRKPCHGYENCCVCPDCVERAAGPLPASPQPKQPWEIAA